MANLFSSPNFYSTSTTIELQPNQSNFSEADMKKQHRITFLTTILILAYVLSACARVPAGVKVKDSSNSQIELSNGNDNDLNDNSSSGNENQNNTNDNLNDNSSSDNDNSNVNENVNSNLGIEVFGVVEAITVDFDHDRRCGLHACRPYRVQGFNCAGRSSQNSCDCQCR